MSDSFQFRPVPVVMTTLDLGTATPKGAMLVPWHVRAARERALRHIFWSLCNNHGVQIFHREAQLHPDIAASVGELPN